MRRERVQQQALVAVESLARRARHARVGDILEPLPSLLIEIGVVDERPTVDETVAQVADDWLT